METCSTLEGTVHSIIFQNPDNGYTVLRLVDEEGEVSTVVGCIPCAAPGKRLLLTGSWTSHPQHGEQFSAQDVERRLPDEEDDILSYLSSGVVRGVGPATAQRMVERFGRDTLDILEQEPERLSELKGVTRKKAMEISASFRSQMELRRLMAFLARYELPVGLAMPLTRRFGGEALDQLRANPYLLVADTYGVDFSVTDEIALSLGLEADSGSRMEAAVLFELSHNENNGHVFLPREKLVLATCQLLDCPADPVEMALDALEERGAVVEEQLGKLACCYLRRLYEAEVYAARKLLLLLSAQADRGRETEQLIDRIQAEENIVYAPLQRQAVELAAQEGVVLLTGGPGTGKTTSVRCIVEMFAEWDATRCCGPHRPGGQAPGGAVRPGGPDHPPVPGHELAGGHRRGDLPKTEKEPLEADAVILDEMSMVDLQLFTALLRALRPDCRLIMVGDPDQLPSVGPGNVFSDLIRSGRIPVVALTEIFRQAQSSAIIRAAHAVNGGSLPPLKNLSHSDFFFLCRRDPQAAVELVVELVKTRLPQNMDIPASQIQVLTPTHKGPAGTLALNRALQAALNPPMEGKHQRLWGERLFREGDRVMQTKNDYDVLWETTDVTVAAPCSTATWAWSRKSIPPAS